MALFDTLHPYYNRPSDVFVRLESEDYGYTRKTLSMTAPLNTVVQVGHLLIDNGDGTCSLPANAAALAAATKIVIFIGHDVIKTDYSLNNMKRNVAQFDADNLTQDVVVVWRGSGLLGKANLIFPAGTTNVQKAAVYKTLTEVNGFKMARQVANYAFEQSFIN